MTKCSFSHREASGEILIQKLVRLTTKCETLVKPVREEKTGCFEILSRLKTGYLSLKRTRILDKGQDFSEPEQVQEHRNAEETLVDLIQQVSNERSRRREKTGNRAKANK